MKIDPIVKNILTELKFKETDCLWEKHGATCMKHRYIEIAGKHKGVSIDALEEVEKNSEVGVVVIKCHASLGKVKVITYGEASPKNNKNNYPYAMAEKRAIDRAILKLIGLHGFVYSEDEVDSPIDDVLFQTTKKEIVQNKKPIKQNSYADKLLEIENSLNAEKPDLSGSTTKLARLKSEINKAHNYSDFLKTKEGKQIIMLDNKLIKMKMNRR
jgi:hypothetical protein